uniref:Uncharacterized protein n=1 Tax=Amphimedon queenslandica TaxID=400682 RepID=A0A1X7V4T1_AMPQE
SKSYMYIWQRISKLTHNYDHVSQH